MCIRDRYVGFDLDLAQEVCERNGWNLVKQPIDWDSKDMELSSGSIDCIWNGFTLNGREREYTWSKAYIDNSQVVIVKSGSGIKKLEDLKGKVCLLYTSCLQHRTYMPAGRLSSYIFCNYQLRYSEKVDSRHMRLQLPGLCYWHPDGHFLLDICLLPGGFVVLQFLFLYIHNSGILL